MTPAPVAPVDDTVSLERQPSVSCQLKFTRLFCRPSSPALLLQFVLVAPAVVYVVAMFAYPLVYGVTMSLEDFTFAPSSMVQGRSAVLANYRTVIHDPVTGTAAINTLIYTTASISSVHIGLGLAVFFNRRFPLEQVVTEHAACAVAYTSCGKRDDLFTTFLRQRLREPRPSDLHIVHHPIYWLDGRVSAMAVIIIVSVWAGIPFFAVLLYSGLQDVPVELIEAAALDGAGPPKRFRYVTLPLLRPVIAIVLMLGLIYTVKTFDIVIVLTSGGPGNATQLLSTDAYTQAFTDFSFGPGRLSATCSWFFARSWPSFTLGAVRPETSGR